MAIIHCKRTLRRSRGIMRTAILASLVLVLACAGGGMSYTGRLAKPESRVPLRSGDAHQLKWQTEDIIVDATYALGSGRLDLAGLVQLQSRLAHYPVVEYLRVSVHALDGDGLILASYPLWSAGANNEPFFVNWSFQQSYAVPETTQALTFSYRGRVRDGGGRGPIRGRDDGGISWDFWHTP